MVAKESESISADLEKRTAYVEDAAKTTVDITIDSASMIPQGKKSGNEEDCQVNTYDKNEANESNEEMLAKKLNKPQVITLNRSRVKPVNRKQPK